MTTRYFPKFKASLPRVDGKVFAITGTTSGTGYIAARTIGELGGEVLLLNRKSSRMEKSLQSLREAVPNGNFQVVECDLQSFSSVRRAVEDIKSKYTTLYCLVNNAGIMASPDEATEDGYDTQMQTNHLSHFLLTMELLPLLEKEAEKTGGARIVNHSSLGRAHTPNQGLEEKYFGRNGGNLGGNEIKLMAGANFHRYFQSKLANSVFTYGLHEKLQARGSKIRVVCAHPGGSDTNLADGLDFGFVVTKLLSVLGPFMMQSSEDGAMGLIKGMVDPHAKSGVLYGPKNNRTRGLPVENPPKKYETDPKAIEMLWRTSAVATGVEAQL